MRTIILMLVAVVTLALGTVVRADEPEIRAVIADQFAALAEGDLPRAFAHASPFIQNRFGTPEVFGRMITSGYPEIGEARAVRYLGLNRRDGRLLERVGVTGPDGSQRFFDYEMIELDGVWRINGVWPVAADSPAA